MGFDFTGLGSVADAAKSIADKFFPDKMSDAEKATSQLELQELLTQRDNTLNDARKDVMMAELNQGDAYTKRARPTLVYAGLLFIFLVHVLFPIVSYLLGKPLPKLSLPEEFWWAWSGVCGAWVLGRSAEKGGAKNRMVGIITGNKGA